MPREAENPHGASLEPLREPRPSMRIGNWCIRAPGRRDTLCSIVQGSGCPSQPSRPSPGPLTRAPPAPEQARWDSAWYWVPTPARDPPPRGHAHRPDQPIAERSRVGCAGLWDPEPHLLVVPVHLRPLRVSVPGPGLRWGPPRRPHDTRPWTLKMGVPGGAIPGPDYAVLCCLSPCG